MQCNLINKLMEEKTLNSQQSLELIAAMIRQSQRKLERGGGTIFLIWGYTSLLVSAVVVALVYLGYGDISNWAWWAIPIIGWGGTWNVLRKRPKQVSTYIDRFIGYIWITIGIVAMLFPIVLISTTIMGDLTKHIIGFVMIPILSTILCIGVTLSGLVLRFRPLIIGGFAAIVLSFGMFFTQYYIYLFMLMFIVSMIIPGHILNCRAKCSKS